MRIAILAYGVLAYAAFLATILYAIGFTTNSIVPKSIDSGENNLLFPALFVNLGLLILFGITHSVMARPAFKETLTKLIAAPAERSTFVLVASLELALVFWLWQPVTTTVWQVGQPLETMLVGISLTGWGLVFWSSFLIDHFGLFGLRQAWLNFHGRTYAERPFMLRGLYKYVRHPLMLGFLVAFWVTPHMTVGHFVFALATTAYILLGTIFEERDLLKQLGDDYANYRKMTPMIIPRFKR